MLGKYISRQDFHKVAACKKAGRILKSSGVTAINLVQHYIHHHAGD
jgi:hypothetical protein